MDGEVTFRRAAVGGFNRSDVLNYINGISVDNAKLLKANEDLNAANIEISRLRAEIEMKNNEIAGIKQQMAMMEAVAAQPTEVANVISGNECNQTAEKLMRESMAYADRYIESANLVALNIRKDTLEKLKDADLRVKSMLERAMVFSQETESFESMLKFFKAQLDEIRKELSE